ncbi:putative Ser/Thr protein kinase [Kitasatospora sp. GP30]|uniref:serine/threonine-protein kinase n=1 Tax=Kitasatospora sp. GP30 TaxID=3035084 RepID=UPI000C712E4A|nr:serine/threonine-protein kinase [Kitasatospora sp. GP30]MDH6142796.1 putative Ser/Thr protein kinase [Kitasatospora sp. GP30]
MAEIEVPGPDGMWDPDSSPWGSGGGGGSSGELIGGRYRLVELIGRGGMGRVWRGRDETLERDVAVKEVMFPQGIIADQREVLLQRVLREARAAAQLNHPGIITVHDVVEHAGAPVIVMEYVAGMSLAAAIEQSGGLPVRRVAEIGAAMLRALSRAHAAGIIHRDLKPDNILLMDDRVIITDFGIAHMVDSTIALTHTGTLIGTPAYMAPEQLSGQTPAPATDLWSLGATLYCAVEGEPPFSAETFTALCIAVVTGMPRPALRAEGLGVVLAALLTKDPVQRAGAAQALAALEEVARTGGAAYVPTRVDTPPASTPGVGPAGPGALTATALDRPNQPPPGAWAPPLQGAAAYHLGAAGPGGGANQEPRMSVPQGVPPSYPAPVRRRAPVPADAFAAALAGCTAIALVWFVLANVLIGGSVTEWRSSVWMNVVSGLLATLALLVPAAFLLKRHVWAAWTLFGLSLLCVVGLFLPQPGTSFDAHLHFVLGFHRSNGVAIGLALIFSFLTAIAAVIAATARLPRR